MRERYAKVRFNPASDSKQRRRSKRWAGGVRFIDYLGTLKKGAVFIGTFMV
jgi:hypothetical protein